MGSSFAAFSQFPQTPALRKRVFYLTQQKTLCEIFVGTAPRGQLMPILTQTGRILLPVLQRYLLRETLSLYLMGVLLFVGLLTFDLLSSLSGAFLRAKTPVSEIILMVLYRMPYALGIALPLGLVFALLVTLARWIRQSELKATYAAGIPPKAFIASVIVVGTVVGAAVLWNEGWIKPYAQERFDSLQAKIYYGSEPSGVLSNRTYTPGGLGIYFAQQIYPAEQGQTGSRLQGIRIVEPGGAIWSAEQGTWVDGAWQLKNASRVDPNGRVSNTPEYPAPFPKGVPVRSVSNEALPMPELHKAASVDSSAVFPLSRRYANAVGVIILAWLAIVVGLGLRESAWAFISIVVLVFGYWSLWTFSAKLSTFGIGSLYGAWLADVVYFLLALLFTWRISR